MNRHFDELALLSEPSFSSRASWENARAAGRRLLRTVLSLRPHSGRKDQMTACIRRRAFITLLGGAAAAWPLAASGQEFGRIYRVGALIVSPRDAPHHVAFFDELRRLGFIDGQNLAVDVGG